MALQKGRAWLGQGIKYPVGVDSKGAIALQNDVLLVQESLLRLLQTERGSIFMHEEYGTNIRDFLFGQNDQLSESLVQSEIENSVEVWENRVEEISIEFENSTIDTLDIRVNFKVTNIAKEFAFVFPFYRELIY